MSHLVVTQKTDGGQKLVRAELEQYVSNIVIPNVECETSVYVGAAVVTNSSGVARNAIADSLANSNVLGFVESKSSTDRCTIRVIGLTGSIFTGLDVTRDYYLSDTVPGGIQIVAPSTTGHVKLKLGQPFSASQFTIIKGERVLRA
jgi:hypothetical protein